MRVTITIYRRTDSSLIFFLRTLFDYASDVKDPFMKIKTNTLYNLQRKSIRFIYKKYGMLSSLSALFRQAHLLKLSDIARYIWKVLIFMIQEKLYIDITKYVCFSGLLRTRSCHAR